jgi:hypothetical protein
MEPAEKKMEGERTVHSDTANLDPVILTHCDDESLDHLNVFFRNEGLREAMCPGGRCFGRNVISYLNVFLMPGSRDRGRDVPGGRCFGGNVISYHIGSRETAELVNV